MELTKESRRGRQEKVVKMSFTLDRDLRSSVKPLGEATVDKILIKKCPPDKMRAAGSRSKASYLRHGGHRPSQVPFIDLKKLQRGAEFACPRYFISPYVHHRNPRDSSTLTAEHVYSGEDIILLVHDANPVILYGQPFRGKTTLFYKLIKKAKEVRGSTHWTHYIEMKQLAEFCRSLSQRPKTFSQLLALQMKTSEKHIKDMFGGSRRNLYTGDLFLDGYDEIPETEMDYFNKLCSPLNSTSSECSVRIWISSRSYMKPKLSKMFPKSSHFDMLPYNIQQQHDLLKNIWKHEFFPKADAEKDREIMEFVLNLFSQLDKIIPGFEVTLGSIPIFIEVVANLFSSHMDLYLNRENDESIANIFQHYAVNLTELIDNFVQDVTERHCIKRGIFQKYEPKLLQKELPNIIELYFDFAVKTYPFFLYDGYDEYPDYVGEDLQRVGLLVMDENLIIRFHHQYLGDYFLGKYFSSPGALDVGTDALLEKFFIYTVLFDSDATGALSYFDISLSNDPKTYSPRIIHDFLIEHYKLGDGQESEWKKIRDYGNIWHLAVFHGYHRLAQFLLNAFRPHEKEQLRRFLRMRVNLISLEGNRHLKDLYDGQICNVQHDFVVSSFSLIALFGHGAFMEEMFVVFLKVFDLKEIQREFNQRGKWSPIHYAAIHTNLWFLMQVWNTDFHKKIEIKPGIYNDGGLLPTHLLMSSKWNHTLTIKDDETSKFYQGGNLGHPSWLASCTRKKNRKGKTASKNGEVDGEENKNSGKLRMIRRHREANLDVRNNSRHLLATLHGCIDILVKKGGEGLDATDRNKEMTMLYWAARDGNLETVRYLLEMGANIDFQSGVDGTSSLHLAGFYGYKTILMCLLKRGATLSILDFRGYSPIVLWRNRGEKVYYSSGGKSLTLEERSFLQACFDLDEIMTKKRAELEEKRKQNVLSESEVESSYESGSSREDDDDKVPAENGKPVAESVVPSAIGQPENNVEDEVEGEVIHKIERYMQFTSLEGFGGMKDAEEEEEVKENSFVTEYTTR